MFLKTTAITATFALLISVEPAPAADVLLLGDSFSEFHIQPALEAAGHNVTYAGLYWGWDGSGLAGKEAVIYLDGAIFSQSLQPAADQALSEYVADGGRLIMAEWTAWGALNGYGGPLVNQLLPVTSNGGAFGVGDVVWQVQICHPLVADLPISWTAYGGWSSVTPHPLAIVLIRSSTGNPLLTYRTDSGGVVVHINHDTRPEISGNTMEVLVRSVDAPLGGANECAADLDGDGAVGVTDLLGVLGSWGPCD